MYATASRPRKENQKRFSLFSKYKYKPKSQQQQKQRTSGTTENHVVSVESDIVQKTIPDANTKNERNESRTRNRNDRKQNEPPKNVNKSEVLTACLMNARSILNKMDELRALLSTSFTDIILITESWTKSTIDDSELKIPGYTFLRKDRKKPPGGGCLIYYKENLKVKSLDSDLDSDHIDSLHIEVSSPNGCTLIGLYYNSPKSTKGEIEDMIKQINSLCDRYKDIIICGDFNFPKIDWTHLNADISGQPFMECVINNYLEQHVEVPTRDKNILDLILSSPSIPIENIEMTSPIGNSDHDSIKFEIRIPDVQ